MRVGFYAGSFDPFTIGHLEVLKKASEIFDKLIVGIGFNPDKKRRFNEQEMKSAIEKVLMREMQLNGFCRFTHFYNFLHKITRK